MTASKSSGTRKRRSSLPSGTQSPRFTGIRTFMRLSQLVEGEPVDAAIVGIPFDTGASFRPGQRFGPSAIRDISVLLRPSNQHHKLNAFEELRVVDAGDVPAIPGDIQTTYDRIKEKFSLLSTAGVVPIGLGGDHSITLGELRGVADHHGPIALVHIDAHCDTWDNYWGLKYTHGTPFRRACEEGLIDTAHSIQVGMRGSEYTPADLDGSRELGFEVMTTPEMLGMTPSAVAERIRKRVDTKAAFLTYDVDFFDPSVAPGTGTPEVGGPSSAFGIEIVHGLVGIDFVGFDVVEVLPALDTAAITALLAATLAFEFVALLAVRRRSTEMSQPAKGVRK